MAPGIDMNDRNAWDDSFLQNSWNDAVAEYNKYHSIHKSGKRLEDILTEEELKELREDHGDLIGESDRAATETNGEGDMDLEGTEMSLQETSDVEEVIQAETQPQAPAVLGQQHQEQPVRTEGTESHEIRSAASMPQAILETVQDENLKNAMMSWYYAGYYTGLYAGQQHTMKKASANSEGDDGRKELNAELSMDADAQG